MWEKKKVSRKDQSINSRDYLARILDTLASVQYKTKSYKTLQAMSRSPAAFSYNWTQIIPKLLAGYFLTSKFSDWLKKKKIPDSEVKTQKFTVMSAGNAWCPHFDPTAN